VYDLVQTVSLTADIGGCVTTGGLYSVKLNVYVNSLLWECITDLIQFVRCLSKLD